MGIFFSFMSNLSPATSIGGRRVKFEGLEPVSKVDRAGALRHFRIPVPIVTNVSKSYWMHNRVISNIGPFILRFIHVQAQPSRSSTKLPSLESTQILPQNLFKVSYSCITSPTNGIERRKW